MISFGFDVISGMTPEQADKLLDAIVAMVEAIGGEMIGGWCHPEDEADDGG